MAAVCPGWTMGTSHPTHTLLSHLAIPHGDSSAGPEGLRISDTEGLIRNTCPSRLLPRSTSPSHTQPPHSCRCTWHMTLLQALPGKPLLSCPPPGSPLSPCSFDSGRSATGPQWPHTILCSKFSNSFGMVLLRSFSLANLPFLFLISA